MKFFKYTVLALALAAGFTSCSDDDDYVSGGASAGVYFPTDDALDVTLERTKSSFDVIVSRMGETKAAVYELTGSADEEVFTLPASVSFAELQLRLRQPRHERHPSRSLEDRRQRPLSRPVAAFHQRLG